MTNARTAALATALLVAACSDSTGPEQRPPASLNVILLPATAPQLCADSVGFYAKKGVGIEAALTFGTASDPCPDGEDFVRLKLDGQSLLSLPDGTPITTGDSVFISMKWVGADSIMVEFQPSGLKFDPAHPAELRIEYGETGDDLNHDNVVDQEDATIEQQMAIWRQENPGDPFVRIGTAKSEDLNEVEATLTGFTRFALAY